MSLKSRGVARPLSGSSEGSRVRTRQLGLDGWQLTLGMIAISALIIGFSFPANFDFWWHLAAGRTIWETGVLPNRDPYSFTAAGRQWIEHSWTLEAVMYGLYRPFGMAGPAALFATAFAGVLTLTGVTLRAIGLEVRRAAPLLILLLPIFLPYIGPRPQVFGFLLFAALIATVEGVTRGRGRLTLVIPGLFLLWANVHGSYIVGLGWLALLLINDSLAARWPWLGASRLARSMRRRLALSGCLAALVIAVNPAGPALWIYPFTKLHNPWLQSINEWRPTEVSDPRYWPFVLLVGGLLALIIVRRQRLPLADLVLTGGLCFAGLYGRRFVPFASLWLVVMAGRVLVSTLATRPGEHLTEAPGSGRARPAVVHRSPVYLGAVLAYLAAALVVVRPSDPGADGRLPVAALDRLGAEGLVGPVFNDYRWGGYLIWRFDGAVPVFIDGRGDDLYMQGNVLPDYFRATGLDADPGPVLDRHSIRTVLFRPDTAFVRYLRATGQWQVIYEDTGAVVFRRVAP